MSDPGHFYHPEKGDTLFHYTTVAGARGILESQSFWLSEYAMSNDKSEYVYAREQYTKAYQSRKVFIEEFPRYLTSIRLMGLEASTVMFIGSLTEQRDDLNQWRLYSKDATGCVIGIDAAYLEEEAGVAMRRIAYDPSQLDVFVNAGLSMLQSQYEEARDDRDKLRELASLFVSDLFAFKHRGYASECEVRVSRLLVQEATVEHGLRDYGGHKANGDLVPALPVKLRNGQFGKTRYIELPLKSSSGSALRSLGFGPACRADDERMLRRELELIPCELDTWRSDLPYRSSA